MTPDQRFARWVQVAIVALVCCFAYFLIADLLMPLTPQAQITRPVVKIAPRVSGQVIEVAVGNNQHVQPGQLLFRLDPQPFLLQVRQAELALEQAVQNNLELDANLQAAQASLAAATARAAELSSQARRLKTLLERGMTSTRQHEEAEAARLMALADKRAAQARIEELRARRGDISEGNLQLRQARNRLEQARLQLAHSEARAERAGIVSNLQLSAGTFVTAGQAVTALVEDGADIIADFREKTLRHVRSGTRTLVVFDALPGKVFAGQVSQIDAGVREGQIDADGILAAPLQSDRWVRDAQRQRLHVVLDHPPSRFLPTGAKATVQLLPENSPIARLLGTLQIRLVSLLHYVY